MLMDFIAMIAAGAGLAGVVLAIRHLSKGRMPRWTIPAVIGAGMLAFTVWNEYTWYARVTGVLPAEVIVIAAPTDSQPWRPWSYLFPIRLRFAAFDGTSLQKSAANPTIRQGDVMLVERWAPTRRVAVAFDCTLGLQADLVDGATLAADGSLGSGAAWRQALADDPLQLAACQEG